MPLKLNIANPSTGQQKVIEIEEEIKMMPFIEKRMGAELPADMLGDEWKGYVLKLTGGNDKQGFPMMQGVIKNGRVRLLFKDGMTCFRSRRNGSRKRKSVRGCIVGHDMAILNFIIEKKGEAEIAGLTDEPQIRRLGPKRASKIRKLFELNKEDDVRKFVVRRFTNEDKTKCKAPKIQRLVTKARVARKQRVRKNMVKKAVASKEARAAYATLCHEHTVALKEKRQNLLAKKKKTASK